MKLSFILIITLSYFLLSNTIYPVHGQSVNHTQLFEERFTEQYTSPYMANLTFPIQYVETVYESPTTIVFRGELITELTLTLNTKLWEAVDLLKGEGFQLNQIINTGAGSKGNPHTLYIIMSKSID